MGSVQSSRYCRTCKGQTLHARGTKSVGFLAGLLLTVLTLGLFLPIWILSTMFPAASGPWRCQRCGRAWKARLLSWA